MKDRRIFSTFNSFYSRSSSQNTAERTYKSVFIEEDTNESRVRNARVAPFRPIPEGQRGSRNGVWYVFWFRAGKRSLGGTF